MKGIFPQLGQSKILICPKSSGWCWHQLQIFSPKNISTVTALMPIKSGNGSFPWTSTSAETSTLNHQLMTKYLAHHLVHPAESTTSAITMKFAGLVAMELLHVVRSPFLSICLRLLSCSPQEISPAAREDLPGILVMATSNFPSYDLNHAGKYINT